MAVAQRPERFRQGLKPCFDPFTLLMLRELVEEIVQQRHERGPDASLGSTASQETARERVARTIMSHALRGERDLERLRKAALEALEE